MNKLYRSLLLTGSFAAVLAGCGDDVTITEPPPPPPAPTPTVRSITVGPDGGSVTVGATLNMTAAVNADAGVATTVSWTSSDNAKATVSGTGVVTGVAVGSVGVRACSTVNTSVCGVATVNVVAAPVAVVTGVTVTPPAATLVIGQQITATATVQGTNSPAQGVTWSSLAPSIATVDAGGVVTAVANGVAVIKATSNANSSIAGTLSVTVFTPQPATISIQSITTGGLNSPVTISNVNGQIEITLNVDNGAYTISRAQALVNGTTVIAEQTFASSSANAAPEAVPSTIVLSLNTRQVVKLANGAYVPVIFNGPNSITARIFVAGSSAPISSNSIPAVFRNRDAFTAGTTPVLTPLSTTPSFSNSVPAIGTTWYKSDVVWAGGPNYVSFFPRTPAIEANSNFCGSSSSNQTGTPQTGFVLGGQFDCLSATFEDGVEIDYFSVTPGSTPAVPADVQYVAADNEDTELVGSPYTVAGTERYNLLSSGSFAYGNTVYIDTQAPTITPNPIGFLSGGPAPSDCETTGITPGCWVGATYDFAADFTAVDGGTGTAQYAVPHQLTSNSPVTCAAAVLTPASLADNTTANAYSACANTVDNIGNATGDVAGYNSFSVDNITPTFTFNGSYAVSGVDPAEVNTNPSATLDYQLTDNNSGIDATVGLSIDTDHVLAAGSCPSPITTLTGSGTTPVTMATPYDISLCVPPGERRWIATGFDRAGNPAVTISRQLEFNPAAPIINAVNIIPNYAAAAAINVDVLATDDEDLKSGELQISTTTNVGSHIRVVFGPLAGFFSGIWGADWDRSLFTATTLGTTARLSLGATYSLAGYVETVGAITAAQGILDTLTTVVYDTYGAASTANVSAINPAFVTASSYTNTNAWAAGLGNIIAASFSGSGACTFEYSTPTNNPEVLSRIWVVNENTGVYTILSEINAQPVLVSDNGIQRLYRYAVRSGTCAGSPGLLDANNIIAIKAVSGGADAGKLVGAIVF